MATTAIFNGTVPESDSDSDVESASAADFLGTYQVFLNFRGPDTRYGFTDYLYHDLVGAGVHTFRDDNELREGEEIGPELFKAINDSKISIPIFSKYYAFSKWCLRELAQMVKCREDGRQMIYPIFYDVEPGEVKRYQDYKDGTFQEAFRKHEEDKELDRDTVQQWKEALKVVGKLKGPELKKVTNGHEGALVKIIVKKVLLKLKKNNMHLPKDLVGMQAHIEKLKELLNSDSNGLRIIGIRGMSGLGKTTIAKAIYNELNKFFESHCFLEDVRGKSQQEVDLINLQKHLLSKILKRKIPKIDDVDEGTKQIKGAIHGKKLRELGRQIVKQNLADPGERCRLWDHGEAFDTLKKHLGSKNVQALCLDFDKPKYFDSHEGPKNWMSRLITVMLDIFYFCINFLYKLVWHGSDKRKNVRKINYLGSRPFLDFGTPASIECLREKRSKSSIFQLKRDWEYNYPCLRGQDFANLSNLRYLSVAFADLDGDFEGVLSNLRWLEWRGCSGNLTPINLYLKNLIILDLSSSRIVDDWKWWNQIKMAKKLKVLNLSCCNHITSVPHLSTFTCLESLQVDGCRSLCGLDGIEQLVSLSYLNTSGCNNLERLPDLSKLGKLKTLNVRDCKKLTAIQGLEKLEFLELLNTSNCYSLERLPNLSNLEKLTSFEASCCGKLSEIEGLDKLGSLEHLHMTFCTSLKRLPDLSNLKKLRMLETEGWRVTEVLGLGELESLEHLVMKKNKCLKRLPDLSKLRRLRKLEILSCEKLIEIEGLDGLESLEDLKMYECRSIGRLPHLSKLKRLKRLDISSCDELIEIPDLDGLDSLERLDICHCKSLERLPDLSNLRKLNKLNIVYLDMLVGIQGLDRLESLEHLDTSHCKSIRILPDLRNLRMLKDMNLRGCTKLHEVRSLRFVESLESLDLSFCGGLGKILRLPNLKNLKKLDVSFCKLLTEIRGLEELESLELLNLSECKSIKKLPDFSNLKNLKDVDVSYCGKLTKIRGLEKLKFLTKLCIVGCELLENLPSLPNTTIKRD
ncbi:hypothetical protein LguiB_010441 [Lonicera macranthoides]